jgi:hypothetical protein
MWLMAIPVLAAALAGAADAARSPQSRAGDAGEPFAVVELFTSEGCSSCPPADRLLGRIAAEARRDGRRIFPLAFHVDYWNSLGWEDPFSDRAFSARQRSYVPVLGGDGPYTPQMIVNGTVGFVGSDEARARRSIEAALRRPPGARIELRAEPRKGSVRVSYEVRGAPSGATLNLALVERGLATEVPRGENAGRKLSHENVVRAFAEVGLGGESGDPVDLAVPAGAKIANCSLLGYVQQKGTMAILGAAEGRLSGGAPASHR